jgi:RND superfamily putative drug exporter
VPNSVIGRAGRWCFTHRWLVLVVWVIAVAGGLLATGPLFSGLSDGGLPHSVESVAASDVLNSATGTGSAGTVVGVVDGIDPTAAPVRSAVTDLAARLAAVPGVKSVQQPFDPQLTPAQAAPLVAPDRRAVLVSVMLTTLDRPGRDTATTAIADQLHALTAALPPGASVQVGGSPELSLQNRAALKDDLQRGELFSLPITLVVLVLVFGGLIAAGLPVLAAVVSVAAAMGVLLGFSHLTDVDQNGVTVVTLLGLGLSVDYGLLLVARYREELARGYPAEVAVARAWATAGRTIMFSALTVAAALSGLLMFRFSTLTALGAAGVSIAVVAMLVALTFTAALLGLAKRWIRPAKQRRARPAASSAAAGSSSAAAESAGVEDERGFFARLSGVVQRRPALIMIATVVLLLGAGLPLLSTTFRLPGAEAIPRSIEAARVSDLLTARFGQTPGPAITVVTRTDAATLTAWAQRWQGDPAVSRIRPVKQADGVSSVGIDVVGDSQGPAARDLVLRLRADRPGGGPSWVTGDPAVLIDLLGLITSALPAAIGVTLLAMLVLLFAMTGSLVVPVKAVLANLVSLGATFGVMTAVFGHGVGSALLHTITTGALNPFVVVIIFAFAFGLSMDYEVFLLGRIKEYVDAGVPTNAAVRRGLQHTGRVITSAALLMVIVFSCFAAATTSNIEQIGLGLTVAVAIDATIVRCLLVPATMTLLGRWNWWAPRWLGRLHQRIGLSDRPLPDEEPAAELVGVGPHRLD